MAEVLDPTVAEMTIAYTAQMSVLQEAIYDFINFMLHQQELDPELHKQVKDKDLMEIYLMLNEFPAVDALWDRRSEPQVRAARCVWDLLSILRPAIRHANLLPEVG